MLILMADVWDYHQIAIALGLMGYVQTVIKDIRYWMEGVWSCHQIVKLLGQMVFVWIVVQDINHQQQGVWLYKQLIILLQDQPTILQQTQTVNKTVNKATNQTINKITNKVINNKLKQHQTISNSNNPQILTVSTKSTVSVNHAQMDTMCILQVNVSLWILYVKLTTKKDNAPHATKDMK